MAGLQLAKNPGQELPLEAPVRASWFVAYKVGEDLRALERCGFFLDLHRPPLQIKQRLKLKPQWWLPSTCVCWFVLSMGGGPFLIGIWQVFPSHLPMEFTIMIF